MAALTYDDSILERILGNYGLFPAGYDPVVDGAPPPAWTINAMQFSQTFWEVHYGRLDDHIATGLVQTFKDLWGVTGGDGDSDIDWLVSQYQGSADKVDWVRNVTTIFANIEIDMSVGESYRAPGALGYGTKANLVGWITALP